MLYFKVINNRVVEIASELSEEQQLDRSWKSRHYIESFGQVYALASEISDLTGSLYLGCDGGEGVWPRFDIIKAPQVGDKVSYSFNGDCYPDGEIVKISEQWQVTTSTGNKYRRRKNSSSWLRTGGTWSLIPGHHFEQNPHF